MAVFDDGTTFRATAEYDTGIDPGWIGVTFSITNNNQLPGVPQVTALEVAQAINTLIQGKGYRKLSFTGPQSVATLNPDI
ncbi:hypothetical protein [Streptomyces tsukubensis]|uniref:hypothetical protein n=1 Tax=Streptomyces tsukubensis TaxID=83656 RepID=UPI00344F8EDA